MGNTSIYSTKELGGICRQWRGGGASLGAGQRGWGTGRPSDHRLCIVGSWLAPKVCSFSSMCEDLVQKAVARSVDGLQVNDNGPMDPR